MVLLPTPAGPSIATSMGSAIDHGGEMTFVWHGPVSHFHAHRVILQPAASLNGAGGSARLEYFLRFIPVFDRRPSLSVLRCPAHSQMPSFPHYSSPLCLRLLPARP